MTRTPKPRVDAIRARSVTRGTRWRRSFILVSRHRDRAKVKVKLSLNDGGTAIELREADAIDLANQIADALERRA